MGYYTSYSLSIHEEGDRYVYIEDAKKEITEYHNYNPFIEANKWYKHEEDMRRLSREYPNTVFILEGNGEDSGDMWMKYFKNGKMQEAKAIITYPEFDPSKLQ